MLRKEVKICDYQLESGMYQQCEIEVEAFCLSSKIKCGKSHSPSALKVNSQHFYM